MLIYYIFYLRLGWNKLYLYKIYNAYNYIQCAKWNWAIHNEYVMIKKYICESFLAIYYVIINS